MTYYVIKYRKGYGRWDRINYWLEEMDELYEASFFENIESAEYCRAGFDNTSIHAVDIWLGDLVRK